MRTPIRRSPVSKIHEALGVTFEREAGWDIPAGYGDEADERSALATSVAIADITPRAKVDIRAATDAALPSLSRAQVARAADGRALVLGAPGEEEGLLRDLRSDLGGTMVTDATHLFAAFALAGPTLTELVARTTSWDPATLETGRATGAPIVDVRSVMVRRDADCLEVYVPTEFARYAWAELYGVVMALGGAAIGWRALRGTGWR